MAIIGFINKNKTNKKGSLFQESKGERKWPNLIYHMSQGGFYWHSDRIILSCESVPCVLEDI